MPAFNKNRASQLKQIIAPAGARIINSHRVEMTSDEMMELYTKEEDREILTKVFTLVAMGSDTQRVWSHPYHLEKGSVQLNICRRPLPGRPEVAGAPLREKWPRRRREPLSCEPSSTSG